MAESKVIDLEVKTNLGSLKSQLREAQAEVAKMSEKFGAASVEATNAAKAAGILKDKIGDAKALTDAFNPDAKFKSVTASISGIAGGFAAYEGAMNLVGIKSQEVEAALLKVQSAMAISQGLQSVGESIDSFKQLGAVIKSTSAFQGIYNFIQTGSFKAAKDTTNAVIEETVATKLQGSATVSTSTATTIATGALKLFRAALITTGIGALVAGLVMAVQYLGSFIGGSEDSEAAQKKLDDALAATNKTLENQKNAYEKLAAASKFANDKQLINALNAGASEKELNAIKLKGAQDNLGILLREYEASKDFLTKTYNNSKRTQAQQDAAFKARDEAGKKYAAELINVEMAQAQSKYDSIKKTTEQEKEEYKKQVQNNKEKNKQKQIDDEKAFELEKALRIKQDEEFADETAALKKQEDEKTALQLAGIEARSAAEREKNAKEKEIRDKIRADEAAADKLELENKQKGNNQKLEMAVRAFSILQDATTLFTAKNDKDARRQFQINKALSLSSAIVNTALGVTSALKMPIELFPGQRFAEAALVGAAGGVSIAKIAGTQYGGFGGSPNGGGGGGAGGSGGGSTPSAPQSAPNFNLVGATGLNQLDMLGKPIQAFVVGGEVTTYQELERNRLRNATL